jgi:hypothetical protein
LSLNRKLSPHGRLVVNKIESFNKGEVLMDSLFSWLAMSIAVGAYVDCATRIKRLEKRIKELEEKER